MADIVNQILARPIQLADQVTKSADDAQTFKQDCQEVKAKTEKLAALLRQAARAGNDLYERPTRRIIDDTEQVLDKALALVIKCRASNIMKRAFTIIPNGAFRKTAMQIENSIGDVQWLLRVSASADDRDDEYLGLPPIAANEPILCLIWEQIAILCTGSLEERSDAAASLVSLARDNDRYGKLIIEEGGISPLLKLAKEGKLEGQENAARAIGLLGRDPECVESIVNAGVCNVFAKILKDGDMKVQAEVAWSVSELAAHHPKCQDHFAQNNIIRFLVSHLAYETVQEHSKYTIPSKTKASSISDVVNKNNVPSNQSPNSMNDEEMSKIAYPAGHENTSQIHSIVNTMGNIKTPNTSNAKQTSNQQHKNNNNGKPQQQTHVTIAGTSIKGRGFEDPATKAQMKAMAARALWLLCKGNVTICRNITESRALLCFAVLLDKGPEEVQSYSAMALMEITAVAEQNSDLRRNAFKPTSPAAKAVVDQLLKIIEQGDSDLLLEPAIRAIGNLARTFRATETRIIAPLVNLLDEKDAEVMAEATIALNKFCATDNFLHVNHCKAVIAADGAKHLVQLVYFGEQMLQIPALVLLGYIALHVPDSESLARDDVLTILEWSIKQAHLIENTTIGSLVPEAKSRLQLYQSRGSRGFR